MKSATSLLPDRIGPWLLAATLATMLVSRTPAQTVMTSPALKALLAEASGTSAQLDTLNAKVFDVSARGRLLAAEFRKHNAEGCEYLQGHQEECANYDRERVDLNLQRADIQKEWASYDDQRKPLRAYFAVLMGQLRDASYPGAMASWKEPMVACSNVNGVSGAAACLARAVAHH